MFNFDFCCLRVCNDYVVRKKKELWSVFVCGLRWKIVELRTIYLLQDLQRVDHDLLAREFRTDGSLNIVLRMTIAIAIKLSNKLHLDVCRADVGRTNVTGPADICIYVLQQSCTVLIIMISTCFLNTWVFIKDLLDLYRLARDGRWGCEGNLRLATIEIYRFFYWISMLVTSWRNSANKTKFINDVRCCIV